MMQRRACVVGAMVSMLPMSARVVAAPKAAKVHVVGVLGRDPSFANGPEWNEFVAELARRGFVEGRNPAFERRFGQGNDHPDVLEKIAVQLVGMKVDVIYAFNGTQTALAAKKATTTIPIVFHSSGDPVGLGLVMSLAHPGGNVTGNSILNSDLAPKSLQFLAEAAGKLTSIANIQPAGTRMEP